MAMDIIITSTGPERSQEFPVAMLVSDLEHGHRVWVDCQEVVSRAGRLIWARTGNPAALAPLTTWAVADPALGPHHRLYCHSDPELWAAWEAVKACLTVGRRKESSTLVLWAASMREVQEAVAAAEAAMDEARAQRWRVA